jgi:DNA-binding CsgD family transcriptional regulator
LERTRSADDLGHREKDCIDAGRAALARCEWSGACAALDTTPLADAAREADRLDLLGEGLWWCGRIDECIVVRECAYSGFDAIGMTRRAGQVAIWLFEHHCFKGRPAIGNGWLQRARRMLEGDNDCVEWGNLLLREAEVAHGEGDYAHAIDNANVALELAQRLRSTDLEAEALQTLGRVRIDDGSLRAGMSHLDEAMLLAVEGRLGPYATGKVYCSLVGACEDVGDLQRAAEWTDATVTWAGQHPFAVFPGLCRVKRAVVLQWRGEWEEAEREARRACEELRTVKVGSAGAAWLEIGEIRRRIGDLAGAEEAFQHAQDLCCAPSAGLALLRMAQGRVPAAIALITDALRNEDRSRLARARLLPAAVQVHLAAGDAPGAAAAASDLAAIADEYRTPALVASAALERGRVLLSNGDSHDAATALRSAAEHWAALDVPYETATAHALLARACSENGDRDGATRAEGAAADLFARLGAAYDGRRQFSSAREHPRGLTAREAEILRLVSSGRTNKQIALELGISPKTIDRHLSNIFTKIGVSSRAAATAFAFEQGLMTAPLR